MAIDPQNPVQIIGKFRRQGLQRIGKLLQLFPPGRGQNCFTTVEQHFRLEDKTVANDAHIIPLAENFPQTAKEL